MRHFKARVWLRARSRRGRSTSAGACAGESAGVGAARVWHVRVWACCVRGQCGRCRTCSRTCGVSGSSSRGGGGTCDATTATIFSTTSATIFSTPSPSLVGEVGVGCGGEGGVSAGEAVKQADVELTSVRAAQQHPSRRSRPPQSRRTVPPPWSPRSARPWARAQP